MWWENPHAEVQEPKKHSTNIGVSWAPHSELDSTWTELLMKQTKMITYKMIVVFFLFFPMWICLMNIEPPLFIFAKTEQRTVLQLFSLESGLVREYAIVSVSSHSTFIISLLDRMTLTKSSTKVTNVESAFTVTNTYKKYYWEENFKSTLIYRMSGIDVWGLF